MLWILKYPSKLVSISYFVDNIYFQSTGYSSLLAHDEGMRTDRGGPLRDLAQRTLPHDPGGGGFSLGRVNHNAKIFSTV